MRAMSKMSQNRAILYASDGFEIPKHFSGIAIVFSPDSHHLVVQIFFDFFFISEKPDYRRQIFQSTWTKRNLQVSSSVQIFFCLTKGEYTTTSLTCDTEKVAV